MVTTFLAPLDLLWELGGMMDKGSGGNHRRDFLEIAYGEYRMQPDISE